MKSHIKRPRMTVNWRIGSRKKDNSQSKIREIADKKTRFACIKKLLKSWDFYAGNGQKLALKGNRMKKRHHIWQDMWPSPVNCSPQGTFFFYMRPEEHFFMFMRPLSGFEFETPGLVKLKTKI